MRLGAAALVDTASRAYREAGLEWLRLDDEAWSERLLAQPRLLRLPLARAGNQLAAGDDEPAWRAWLA